MEAAGKRYILHPSRSDVFTIWNIADIHYGNSACAVDRLQADIERIRTDPNALWVGGGDYGEYISIHDRRFDAKAMCADLRVADLSDLGHVLTERVRDFFHPIRHKCLGLLMGNHERHYQHDKEQTNLHGWLCTELGVPNMEYSCMFDLVFQRNPRTKTPRLYMNNPTEHNSRHSFRFFVHHGAGGATTPGGKLNKLIQFMDSFDADVYMCGHVHDKKGQRLVTVGANDACDKIVARERLGIISASYLKTYASGTTTYGEQKGYRPVPLGATFVRIKPETREMTAEI